MPSCRPLTDEEIRRLMAAGCRSDAWTEVSITNDTDLACIRDVVFRGRVRLDALGGSSACGPSEIVRATLSDVTMGAHVRVVNIHGELRNLDVGENAVLVNIGSYRTLPGATFGNGVEVEAVNEGGGRNVTLHDGLTSQTAALLALHRWRPRAVGALEKLIGDHVRAVKSDRGAVGACAVVENVPELENVRMGPHAAIRGAMRLRDGTILSEEGAPTFVGAGVVADHFIIAEGASVDTGAMLDKVFVGQGTRLGKSFSAENALFFANCEGFHSEVVAALAGPYTVTHHRSTLLIAGVFSFYNAGSATNQSNHMYKLGPVHQGIVERGSKTASGSYMLWPSVVGPFCVVMGKNMTNFDGSPFPFSYITAEDEGTTLTPAMNMATVGTVRDGDKWPKRDRRKATHKRDQIHFDVFSPFTAGRMLEGERILGELADSTDKSQKTVRYNGLLIKRLLLRKGAKDYASGIDRYLHGEILRRLGAAGSASMKISPGAKGSRAWSDIGGMLVNRERFDEAMTRLENGGVSSIRELQGMMEQMARAYAEDSWAWVRTIAEERFGRNLDELTHDQIAEMQSTHQKLEESLTKKILADGEKEFGEEARLGYGSDGDNTARDEDFEAVRGSTATNPFITGLKAKTGRE